MYSVNKVQFVLISAFDLLNYVFYYDYHPTSFNRDTFQDSLYSYYANLYSELNIGLKQTKFLYLDENFTQFLKNLNV